MVDMCIDLCGRDVCMSEQLLDDPQVRPALQQVRAETVPKGMRANLSGHSRRHRRPSDDPPYFYAAKRPSGPREEHRC